MTKEEAKKFIDDNYDLCNVLPTVKSLKMQIDKIYNDFESRTCDNCKHSYYMKEADFMGCRLEENQTYCYNCNEEQDLEVTKSFCCNKWKESKDE